MNDSLNNPNVLSLDLLRSGNKSEFAQLVERFSGKIYNLALKVLNNQHDAEDALQETFIKIYQALPSFKGESKISTWIYRIAMNEALMVIRKRKPEFDFYSSENGKDNITRLATLTANWSNHPEKELLSNESRAYLEEAVQQLPEKLKIVFLLRDIEGLNIKETAEVLTLTEENVKVRLWRARSHLRELLSKYFGVTNN